jgi:pantothenate kinase
MRFILAEGNYLLLDEEPWTRIAPLFDFTIFLNVPRDELERRLMQRWHEHGKTDEEARAWIASNDMPNIDRVLARRRAADLVI